MDYRVEGLGLRPGSNGGCQTNGIHKNIGWHTLGTLLKANDRSPIPNF
jgi:hypothetical protein